MKKILILLTTVMMLIPSMANAQRKTLQKAGNMEYTYIPTNVMQVGAIFADDGFVNIREEPKVHARVLGKAYRGYEGDPTVGILGKYGKWLKVQMGKIIGYADSRYVGAYNFYTGQGKYVLIAKNGCLVKNQDYSDENKNPTIYPLKEGTIIGDSWEDADQFYYFQTGVGSCLIPKDHATVVPASSISKEERQKALNQRIE